MRLHAHVLLTGYLRYGYWRSSLTRLLIKQENLRDKGSGYDGGETASTGSHVRPREVGIKRDILGYHHIGRVYLF